MQENIINTYKKILEHSNLIQAAIKEKDWERVNILATHREELIQQTAAFLSENKDLPADLKAEINGILKEIQKIDDTNFKMIYEDRADLEKLIGKLNIGQRALNAYKGQTRGQRSSLDKHI